MKGGFSFVLFGIAARGAQDFRKRVGDRSTSWADGPDTQSVFLGTGQQGGRPDSCP